MKKYTYLLTTALFLLSLSSVRADLGVKLGESLTGDRIGQRINDAKIAQNTYLIKEKPIADVIETSSRKSGKVSVRKTERIKAERETTERLRNKKKKVLNAN